MAKRWSTSLTMVAAAVLLAVPVVAAELGLAPVSVTMSVPSGESGSTTLVGSVTPPPPMPFSLSVQLRPVGGSMPASWLVARPAVFTNRTGPLPLPLTVTVPASAQPGTYAALIQPAVMTTSIPLTPAARPLQLSVTVPARCLATPTPAIASTEPSEFRVPNGRMAGIDVSGTIVVPPGCSLTRAWYVLSDEYGDFGGTGELAAAADGRFSFAASVQVSRRGDDRDGRAYQFTVYATDEAGTGSSAPSTVVVRHDQRKGQ